MKTKPFLLGCFLVRYSPITRRILLLIAVGAIAVTAWPEELSVYQVFTPIQDEWQIPERVHELGVAPIFPPREEIRSAWLGDTQYNPCDEVTDNPNLPNMVVEITNLTGRDWRCVWYVADAEPNFTLLSNWDELVGQTGTQPAWYAFKIDSVGVNQPLISESLNPDGVFEDTEVWEFVIQDYLNSWGGAPHLFNSIGAAAGSSMDQVSTGSILVPEPAWGFLAMGLAGLGAAVIARRRTS